jgi:hypothetical protein
LIPVAYVNLISDDDDEDVQMEGLESKRQSAFRSDSGFCERTNQMDTDDFDMDVQYDAEATQSTIQDQSNQSELSMMPTSTESFEYSYQSQEFIDNHWAGPSYWKFNNKSLCESMSSDKKLRRHKSIGIIQVEDVVRKRFNEDECFIKDTSDSHQLRRSNIIYRRHTLPMNFEITPEIIDRFGTSKNLDIYAPIVNEVMDSQEYDDNYDDMQDSYESATLRSCAESTCFSDGFGMSHDAFDESFQGNSPQVATQDTFESPSFSNIKESTQLSRIFSCNSFNDSQMSFCPRFTSSQVQVYQKPTNIKAIKSMNQTILESEKSLYGNGRMKFSELTKRTSKMLEGMHSSTALIFQAILQQANEKKVEIISEFNNIDDFFVSVK